MEISYTHRFAFVHVPKTAGDSISAAVRPWCTDGPWRLDRRRWKHAPARAIRSEFLRPPQWGVFFSWAVVRNPWEWLHSHYHYQRMMAEHYRLTPVPDDVRPWAEQLRQNAGLTFRAWVAKSCDYWGGRGGPLRHWCCDAAGRQIVRHVVRFDRLADEWPAIRERCGLPESVELPHQNETRMPDRSRRPHYADEYSDADRQLVGRVFANDVATFGFRFGQ